MRAVGWAPLEPYPGALRPWRCVCTECGTEGSPRYAHLKSRGRACRVCSKARVAARLLDAEHPRAEADMRAAGFEPLEPYPGAHRAWRSRHASCGRVVAVRLVQVRIAGRGCPVCSGGVAIDSEGAAAFMRGRGLEPLESYPGAGAPWRCLCLACGLVGAPAYGSVRAGGTGCVRCGKSRAVEARRAGFAERAVADMRAMGLEPLEPYRSSTSRWKCRHRPCRRVVFPTHHMARIGLRVCRQCSGNAHVEPAEAHARMVARGQLPLEPYPGRVRAPWRVRCVGCGAEYRKALRGSGGCRRCRPFGFDHGLPALVYVLHHPGLNAVKVGITNPGTTRLATFRRAGWSVVSSVEFAYGADAFDVEQQVLYRLRNELRVPAFVTADRMPYGGATETACADLVDPATLWALVREEHALVHAEPG